jgi:hypothetical protein
VLAQVSITIQGYITASTQLMAYRGFARAGDSLDKIISLTHGPYLLGADSKRTPFFDTSGSVQMNIYTLLHHPFLDHYPMVIRKRPPMKA